MNKLANRYLKKEQKQKLQALSPERKALLAQMLRQKLSVAQTKQTQLNLLNLPTIIPDHNQQFSPFPLTKLQQAYWIGRSGEVELGKVASHSYLELEGHFDLQRLNDAWQQLIQRHDILRAIILPEGKQQVLPEVPPYEFRLLDLRGQEPGSIESQLKEVRHQMSHQILPSDRWPLFDIQTTLIDDTKSRIHVSIDALIADGWSLGLIYDQWAALYHQPATGLEKLEIKFRDYVLSENALADSEEYRLAQDYWHNRLETLPLGPELPLAKHPSALTNGKFVRREATIEPQDWQAIKAKAGKLGITPPGILAAAYAEVLSFWSKERHFCINVPNFNRLPLHPQVNQLVGEAASFSILEVDNSKNSSFAERAQNLQQQLWRDLDHRFYSGVEILRQLAIARQRLSGSLMPIVFTAIPDGKDAKTTYPAVRAEALGKVVFAINQTSQVWLDNHVFEHEGALHCHWDTVEELFPEGLSQNMLNAFIQLLKLLAQEKTLWQQSWSDIMGKIMDSSGQRLSAVGEEQPMPEILLQDLIARQVPQRPHQPAVITRQRTLTYQELEGLSNRWGRHLRALGAKPNQTIGIVMEKGWEQVVAALGVLKAGAAYLPIDVTVGKERLAYLLDNGRVMTILTQSWLERQLDWPDDVPRYCIDLEELDDTEENSLEPIQRPDDLAFLLYTSGSTGLPKGVMVAHRGLVNAVVATQERFQISSEDRILALTALHHDMSIFDLFGVLGAGGTMIIPEPSGRRDPSHWSELMIEHSVTLWNSVPAMMEMLLAYGGDRSNIIPTTLRLAFLGGDWIPLTIPQRLAAQVKNARVVSVGGPTETTLWNIWYPVEEIDPNWQSIPYGSPISNTRYYIMNEALVECPEWVTGEMCVAGVGVAQGYWQDAEQTAAKFIYHPRTGERLYRTGDLGRFRADGAIEFMGRVDFQVKINGQRLELGEIESSLLQHQDVNSAIVTATSDARGKKQLAAYIIAPQGREICLDNLRAFLEERLPDHMIPAYIVPMVQFPLTRNGKVDRRALPNPSQRQVKPSQDQKQQQLSELQTKIACIVAEVLHIDNPQLEDNLVSLGANSLDMVRIGNRLEAEFQTRPRIDELFRLQSIQALVDYYESRALPVVSFNGKPSDAALLSYSDVLKNYTVILDPVEREAFKKSRPGVRCDLSAEEVIQLTPLVLYEELKQRYLSRRSYRKFLLQPISFVKFSQFLSCLAQIKLDGQAKFLYASPGGLNSTQVYLHVKPGRIEQIPAGVYYYHPEEHQLITLTPNVDLDRSIHIPFINTPMFDECAFSIFFIADLDAIGPGYGDRGIHFVTLESGIMAHQLEIFGPTYDIGLCQVGSVDFEKIRSWFKLKDSHILIHSTLGGYIDPNRSSIANLETMSGQTPEKIVGELLSRIKSLAPQQAQEMLQAYSQLQVK